MKRLFGGAVLVLALAGGVSCGDSTASGPGTLKVRLSMPPANSGLDSAIVFTIASPTPLTSVSAPPGLRLFQQPLGGTGTRFALIGQLTNGATILTIGVQDISQLNQYGGSIEDVAQANSQLRPPGGYALAVTR